MITQEQLYAIEVRALAEGAKISQAVGDNWYPCGFANLKIGGMSSLIKLFKTKGNPVGYGRDGYQLGLFRAFKDTYAGGYTVYFDYPYKNATECQSLNFSTPLYQFIQSQLAQLDVVASVETRVD